MEADCMNPEAEDELEPLPVVLRIRAVKSRPIVKRLTLRRLALQAMAPLTVLAATIPLFALILFVFWQVQQPIVGEPPLEIVQATPAPLGSKSEAIVPEPNIVVAAKPVAPTTIPTDRIVPDAPTFAEAPKTELTVPAARLADDKAAIPAVRQASYSNDAEATSAPTVSENNAGAVQIRSVYPVHSVLARFRPEADKLVSPPIVPAGVATSTIDAAAPADVDSDVKTESKDSALAIVQAESNQPASAEVANAHYSVRTTNLPPVADHRVAKPGGLFQGKMKFWVSNRKLPPATTSRTEPRSTPKIIRTESSDVKLTGGKAPRSSLFGFGRKSGSLRENFDPTVVRISAKENATSAATVTVAPDEPRPGEIRLDATNLVPAAPVAAGNHAADAPTIAVE